MLCRILYSGPQDVTSKNETMFTIIGFWVRKKILKKRDAFMLVAIMV